MSAPRVIGVAGAGTMGAGIAQLACLAGARTLLYDPLAEALDRGIAQIRGHLARGAERGRYTVEDARAAAERLERAGALEDLTPCELVIEAAPERLELKRELFGRLTGGIASDAGGGVSEPGGITSEGGGITSEPRPIVSDECVLATNTSSLLVTAVAAGAARPERVVGMHFFNPAPLMRLLEVVAGAQSSPEALAVARTTGEAMGKVVIDAVDGPGFLVNRCNRPFGLEGQKLAVERVASVEEIDRICRMEGGFRMGPFELSDLVGVDVGLEIARSFFEQSFGEPRWRPSQIVVKTVAAGRYGRKAGRGYYDYAGGSAGQTSSGTANTTSGETSPATGRTSATSAQTSGAASSYRPPDSEPLPAGGGDGVVVVAGESPLAMELREAAAEAGWDVLGPEEAGERQPPSLILDLTAFEDPPDVALEGGPLAICCSGGSLAALDPGGNAVGFNALPPLADAQLVELTRGLDSAQSAADTAERFFATIGKHTAWVGDAPGLVLGRIVCQVINECAFALGEGIGRTEDIDAGMVHGLSYPRGPLAWADEIGLDHVVGVLDGLYDELHEERYRVAPVLRRLSLSGRLGRQTGEGFFRYD